MSLIEGHELSRSFTLEGSHVIALRTVSLELKTGELVAITGPSGSGKSTLLNLLSGLDKPSGGEVLFRGALLSELSEPELASLRNTAFGFIFQTPHVLPYKTVRENVALPFHYGSLADGAAMWDRVDGLLGYVGLAELATRYPSTLSGGELQRLVFARALVKDPSVIFADEPTGSLDAENSRRLLTLLREQAQMGKSVMMATHDSAAIQYATRRIDLDKFVDAPVSRSHLGL